MKHTAKNGKNEVEGLINPLTSFSATYSDEEREFMMAMDRYRRINKRIMPGCSEVLAVLKSLGYRKVEETTSLPNFNQRDDTYSKGPKKRMERDACDRMDVEKLVND